jgi:dTDP-4-dehydrorhamnose reductase
LKILVTGAQGQIGWELATVLRTVGEIVAVDRNSLDLGHPHAVRRMLREVRPDVVVNAAGYTAVDKAQSEPELARLVNAVGPGIIAEELRNRDGLLVHYSTDYVFDGQKAGPYEEDDATGPLNIYGATKLEGEEAIQASGVSHLIFRTSWIYGTRGNNFLLTMLRLFEQREELRIVDDQVGAPTWSRWVAQQTAQILLNAAPQGRLRDADRGIYHLSAAGATSWFGFAAAIRERCRASRDRSTPRLIPITTPEYPTPARRPANSVLSNAKLAARFGGERPSWEQLLAESMDALHAPPEPAADQVR